MWGSTETQSVNQGEEWGLAGPKNARVSEWGGCLRLGKSGTSVREGSEVCDCKEGSVTKTIWIGDTQRFLVNGPASEHFYIAGLFRGVERAKEATALSGKYTFVPTVSTT